MRVVRSWELVSRFVGRRYHHQLVQCLTHNGDCCLSVRKGPEILRESYRHPAALNTGLFFVEDFYNTEKFLCYTTSNQCLLRYVCCDPGRSMDVQSLRKFSDKSNCFHFVVFFQYLERKCEWCLPLQMIPG